MTEPACLRIADVAERWSCSPGKVRSLIKSGDLPALRLGTMLRVPVAALSAFEARCEIQISPASAASPAETHGTSITPAVASLRAARIEQARRRSSPAT